MDVHQNSFAVHFNKAVAHAFIETKMCVQISEVCDCSDANEKCLGFLV